MSAAKHTPQGLHASPPPELLAAAAWLQEDAMYLYASAAKDRDEGRTWITARVQENAARSAALARAVLAKAGGAS